MDSSKGSSFEKGFGNLVPKDASVELYEMKPVETLNRQAYSEIKASFPKKEQSREGRFRLSEYVANQLSVEEEDEQRFKETVQAEVERRLQESEVVAKEEGFKAGTEEGKSLAFEEAQTEITQRIDELKAAAEDIRVAKEKLGMQYAKEMTELSVKIASILTHHEMEHSPELIHHTISEMLERVSKKDDVVVRMSKDYAGCLDHIIGELDTTKNSDRRIQFELEPDLKKGQVVIESMSGEVASFISEKVQLLEGLLLENLQSKGES